jgi:GT2 family glycosyltransferase
MSPSPIPISVVVPTYNRLDQLRRVLEALAAQDVREEFEVIVVSDGSTDGTDQYLTGGRTPLEVRPILQTNSGPAAARNAAIALASGELVVFVDDDVVADPGLLRAHHDAHAGDDALVTIGPMLNPVDHVMAPWVRWEQTMLARQYDSMVAGRFEPTARQFYTGNAAVRRHRLAAVNGFDTAFRRAEDIELAFRLEANGVRFVFLPNAVAYHYAERTYESWRSNAYAYGRNDIVFARDHGHTWIYTANSEKYSARVWRGLNLIGRHPPMRRLTTVLGSTASRIAERVGARDASERILSGVYALDFQRGMIDEAGGVEALNALMRETPA